MSHSATAIRYCIVPTLYLIRDCTQGAQAQQVAIKEVHRHCRAVAQMLYLYQSADSEDVSEDGAGLQDEFYSSLCTVFSDCGTVFSPCCIELLKKRLKEKPPKHFADTYRKAIRKYEPDFDTPTPQAKKPRSLTSEFGCYIATAVYGSYDCPPVWTLRRFRDTRLSASWYGRCFIRVYYAVSPTMVRLFGNTKCFQGFFRRRLDRFVARLQAKGYACTPYQDEDHTEI